jgi:hypothetical protein
MSVWASIEGTVRVGQEQHFSLKKWTDSIFDEYTITCSQPFYTQVRITFCAEASDAVKGVEKWLAGIPGKVDIEATIRYIKQEKTNAIP